MKDQQKRTAFRFGLEAEYLLADALTFEPLWHDRVRFETLNRCFERVETDDLPSLLGLRVEAPHKKQMPFIVEGYHLPEAGPDAFDILPKGAEIRTPVCESLSQLMTVFETLHDRMQASLAQEGLAAVALSHHPVATRFHAPQAGRRHDLWLWAMEAMTTYGPDINVSFPDEISSRIDLDDLRLKINHYAPAMTALSVASPFCGGNLWQHRGKLGKSFRTFRRSIVAPPLEVHPQENGRIEFKIFEMSRDLQDFENYFLLFLALVLDDRLRGRASSASRVYDMGSVALNGLDDDFARERANELIASAFRTLPAWGFDPFPLHSFAKRVDSRVTPADEMIEQYRTHGKISAILRERSTLKRSPVPLQSKALSVCH